MTNPVPSKTFGSVVVVVVVVVGIQYIFFNQPKNYVMTLILWFSTLGTIPFGRHDSYSLGFNFGYNPFRTS